MVLTNFELGAYILTAFFTVFGLMFLWIGKNTPVAPTRGVASVVNTKAFMLLFGFLYMALAHISLYMGILYNVEFGNNTVCENIVANSTNNAATGVTTYEFVNSCAGLAVPDGTTAMFTVVSWILYIDIFAVFVGMMLLFFRMLARWQ